jgi:hypothetical protein
MEIKAEYQVGPADDIFRLLNYLTSSQIGVLADALEFVRCHGQGFGGVEIMIERGECKYIAPGFTWRAPKGSPCAEPPQETP